VGKEEAGRVGVGVFYHFSIQPRPPKTIHQVKPNERQPSISTNGSLYLISTPSPSL
jgi:hypothetical protein